MVWGLGVECGRFHRYLTLVPTRTLTTKQLINMCNPLIYFVIFSVFSLGLLRPQIFVYLPVCAFTWYETTYFKFSDENKILVFLDLQNSKLILLFFPFVLGFIRVCQLKIWRLYLFNRIISRIIYKWCNRQKAK